MLSVKNSLVEVGLLFRAVTHHLNALPHLARAGGSERGVVQCQKTAWTDDEAAVGRAEDGLVLPGQHRKTVNDDFPTQNERVGIGNAAVKGYVVINGSSWKNRDVQCGSDGIAVVDDMATELAGTAIYAFHPYAVRVLTRHHLQVVGAGPEEGDAVDVGIVRGADGVNVAVRVAERERGVAIDLVVRRLQHGTVGIEETVTIKRTPTSVCQYRIRIVIGILYGCLFNNISYLPSC